MLLFIAMIGGATVAPMRAVAIDDAPSVDLSAAEQREFWQTRYRTLRQESARLEQDIAFEWELYADANRRNYRRGNARHVHRDKALELEARLKEVDAELEALPERARQLGALPGWLREVESEPIALPPPGASDEEEDAPGQPAAPGSAEDRAGRNPLYLEESDR